MALDQNNLDQIRLIVKDEVSTAIAVSENTMQGFIQGVVETEAKSSLRVYEEKLDRLFDYMRIEILGKMVTQESHEALTERVTNIEAELVSMKE